MKLSVVIPAFNEEGNIKRCLDELRKVIRDQHALPYEILVVDDNSIDETAAIVQEEQRHDSAIQLVRRTPPGGFGRAVRAGIEAVTGDVVVIFMADLSDDPQDVIAYYRKIAEGYDCVFGSRFIRGSRVTGYPRFKRIVNRIVNRAIQWMFWTRFNDLSNAFKAFRTEVLWECGPFRASHFNITLELSLGVLARRYLIAEIPISWTGRTAGHSNLRLREMSRRYLTTLIHLFCDRLLIPDDLLAERLAARMQPRVQKSGLETRVERIEEKLESLRLERLIDTVVAPVAAQTRKTKDATGAEKLDSKQRSETSLPVAVHE